MELELFAYWIGIAATVAFSATAVLAISDRGVDLFGAITLGFTTAVGGGIIRDIILDVPVFLVDRPELCLGRCRYTVLTAIAQQSTR